MGRGRYLYAFVHCSTVTDLGQIGIGEPPLLVWTVPVQGVAGLVSAARVSEISLRRRDLTAHRRVLDVAMARWRVLPVRFGIVCPNERSLLELIRREHRALAAALERAGKGARASCVLGREGFSSAGYTPRVW